MKTKYTSTKLGSTIWLVAFIVNAVIGILHLFTGLSNSMIVFDVNIYHHISNFSISYILLSTIGLMWLLQGVGKVYIFGLSCFIVFMNFIFEFFISIDNVKDPMDFAFGLAGTLLGYFILILVSKQLSTKQTK